MEGTRAARLRNDLWEAESMDLTFLAQGATAEAAKETVGVIQTILSGGPLLILAVLVVVQGRIIYQQYMRIQKLEEEFRVSSVALLKDQIAQVEPMTQALTQTNDMLRRVDKTMKETATALVQANTVLGDRGRGGRVDV
jgi:hypothetical protein